MIDFGLVVARTWNEIASFSLNIGPPLCRKGLPFQFERDDHDRAHGLVMMFLPASL